MIELLKECIGKEIEVYIFGASIHGRLDKIITDRILVLSELSGIFDKSYVNVDSIQSFKVRF